jgi:glycosyltransferase involved in cell wall biosynthesis
VTPEGAIAVVAPVHPQVSGGAQFNTAMVGGLRELGPVLALSWRRLYPPLIHRRDALDLESRPTRLEEADHLLDWADPRTWRKAVREIEAARASAVILPWLHPVMAPPYLYLLQALRKRVRRVVICHNVLPHDPVPLARPITQAVLRRADLLVTHAHDQHRDLEALRLTHIPAVDSFHPTFDAPDLCRLPTAGEIAAERARQGNPDLSLLAFGAIRPYKGIDLALEALALLPRTENVRLTVAGVFWDGGEALRRQVSELGLADKVELRDGFVANEEAALLFGAADASVLPYRSATQSGVVQLSFGFGVPVIATAVGGLPEAVSDGRDGILCAPHDPQALATAIQRMQKERKELAAGVRTTDHERSFRHYGELIHAGLEQLETTAHLTIRRTATAARARQPGGEAEAAA